jgi:hypothetical protein
MSRQAPRELGRRDHDELGRRPGQADVEELLEPLAVGRKLDENDDLVLHPPDLGVRFSEPQRLGGDQETSIPFAASK